MTDQEAMPEQDALECPDCHHAFAGPGNGVATCPRCGNWSYLTDGHDDLSNCWLIEEIP